MALDPGQISFRRLTRDDFPQLQRWLNTPHVLEWWDKPGPTLADVEKKYSPRVEGRDPTDSFIIEYAARPIGYIQRYLIEDYPDYAQHIGPIERAAGIDLFIGEADLVHRGLGAPLLKQFVRDFIFSRPSVVWCVIGPAISNRSAIRAYEKAGFVHYKTAVIPNEDEPEYLMKMGREETG
ncbi:MAG TPA: GNAT family N-acetyltransferase [Nitrolancea sp.]|nr:GNAT family N-acetyltransferase [Nitrolancea sp.]